MKDELRRLDDRVLGTTPTTGPLELAIRVWVGLGVAVTISLAVAIALLAFAD